MSVSACENVGLCILMVCVPFYMSFLRQQQKHKSTLYIFPSFLRKSGSCQFANTESKFHLAYQMSHDPKSETRPESQYFAHKTANRLP